MASVSKNNPPGFLKKNWPLLFALLYLVFPIDLLPDAIPGLGTVDDSILLLLELLRQYSNYRKENDSNSAK